MKRSVRTIRAITRLMVFGIILLLVWRLSPSRCSDSSLAAFSSTTCGPRGSGGSSGSSAAKEMPPAQAKAPAQAEPPTQTGEMALTSTEAKASVRTKAKALAQTEVKAPAQTQPKAPPQTQLLAQAQVPASQVPINDVAKEENVPNIGSPPKPAPSSPAIPEKMVVLGKTKRDNTDWVQRDLPDWAHSIYHVDDPSAPLHPPVNKGKESMVYLTYLIDHYAALPATIAFVHAHNGGWPQAWHTDNPEYSNTISLRTLNIPYVQRSGYVNLRCNWSPGCPNEIQPLRDGGGNESERAFQDAWKVLFNGTMGEVPRIVGVACCAQFAVSRDQILKRPLEDYVRFRRWITETELDDDVSGRVMEYTWHIIFGKPAVFCPAMHVCRCNVYEEQYYCNMLNEPTATVSSS